VKISQPRQNQRADFDFSVTGHYNANHEKLPPYGLCPSFATLPAAATLLAETEAAPGGACLLQFRQIRDNGNWRWPANSCCASFAGAADQR
jgi:hypothetical protein